MKIAVYTISKNEESNTERFLQGAQEADHIVILDTGSTDKTVQQLQKHPKVIIKQEEITPWRFDTARNRALQLVPDDVDICISIDLDESMRPGWRSALEKAWTPQTILASYWYHSNYEQARNGKEHLISCWRTKIHTRHDFRWERSIHEMIVTDRTDGEQINIPDMIVTHHRTIKSDYQEALNKHIQDNPEDPEAYLQRAGDHLDKNQHQEAIRDHHEYLRLTTNKTDILTQWRRSITHIALAKSHTQLNNPPELIHKHLLHAVAEYPQHREAWVYLAEYYTLTNNPTSAHAAALQALRITTTLVAREEACWTTYPQELANNALKQVLEHYKEE